MPPALSTVLDLMRKIECCSMLSPSYIYQCFQSELSLRISVPPKWYHLPRPYQSLLVFVVGLQTDIFFLLFTKITSVRKKIVDSWVDNAFDSRVRSNQRLQSWYSELPCKAGVKNFHLKWLTGGNVTRWSLGLSLSLGRGKSENKYLKLSK